MNHRVSSIQSPVVDRARDVIVLLYLELGWKRSDGKRLGQIIVVDRSDADLLTVHIGVCRDARIHGLGLGTCAEHLAEICVPFGYGHVSVRHLEFGHVREVLLGREFHYQER